MIGNIINSAFSSAWANIVYYASFQFLDPIWFWAMCLVVIYVAVMLVCYFFSALWPPMRAVGGVILLLGTFGLYAYFRGEKGAREHDEAAKPKAKPHEEPWRSW